MDKISDIDDIPLYQQKEGKVTSYPLRGHGMYRTASSADIEQLTDAIATLNKLKQDSSHPSQAERIYMDILKTLLDKVSSFSRNSDCYTEMIENIATITARLTDIAIADINKRS